MRSGLGIAAGILAALVLVFGAATAGATYDEVLSVVPENFVTVIGTGSFDAAVAAFLGKQSQLAEIDPNYQETVHSAFETGLFENLGPEVMAAIDRSGGFAVAFMQQAVPAYPGPVAYIAAVNNFDEFVEAFRETSSTEGTSPEIERIETGFVKLSVAKGDSGGVVYIVSRGRYVVIVQQDKVTARSFHEQGPRALDMLTGDEREALSEEGVFLLFNAKAFFTEKKVGEMQAALAQSTQAPTDKESEGVDPVAQAYAGLFTRFVEIAAQTDRVTLGARTTETGFDVKAVVTFRADSDMAAITAAQKPGELDELALLPPETAYALALDLEATDSLRTMVSEAVAAMVQPVLAPEEERRFTAAIGKWIAAFRFKGVIGFALPERKLTGGSFRSLGALAMNEDFTAATFKDTYGAAGVLLGALDRPLTIAYDDAVTTHSGVAVNRIAAGFDFAKNAPQQAVAEMTAFYGEEGPVVDYALADGRLLYTMCAPWVALDETAASDVGIEAEEGEKVKLSLIEKLIDLSSGEADRFVDTDAFKAFSESMPDGANIMVVTDLPRYGWLLLKGAGGIADGLDEYNPFWDLEMPDPSDELTGATVRFKDNTAHIDAQLPAAQIAAFKEMFVRAVERIR